MSSHQAPVFALPSHPQRTLIIVRRSCFGLLLFLLLVGGWRLVINQSAADSLRQRNVASLSRSVITVRSKPGEASHKIVLPASLRGNTETQLYARSNGYLSAWYKTLGDQVKQGELLAVTQIDPLRLTVWVPQAYADDVKVGQDVAVRATDAQGKTVAARVEHIAGALDPVNRSR